MCGKKNNRRLVLIVLMGTSLVLSRAHAAVKDSDADGLTDQAEIDTYHTDPHNPDTDSDGFSDTDEVLASSNPLDAQSFPTPSLPSIDENRSIPWRWFWIGSGSGLVLITLIALLSATRKKNTAPSTPVAPQEPVA